MIIVIIHVKCMFVPAIIIIIIITNTDFCAELSTRLLLGGCAKAS